MITDPSGVPLAVRISAANEHDVNHLLPLVFNSFPRDRGRRGRPRSPSRWVRADQERTSRPLLNVLAWCGNQASIPQRGPASESGPGKLRWPVEQTISWLKPYRRVGLRRERRVDHYGAFVNARTLTDFLYAIDVLISSS